ncbi:MAG: glycosyltransferase family 9 protein [Chloroflexota bacterium]
MRLRLLRAGGAALRLSGGTVPARLPAQPRLLLVRPDHLGDLLMAGPAVELLRKALPQAHLTMMVGPWGAEIARRDPLLDEVLTCPFPGFTREPKGSALAPYRLLWRTARGLKQGRYDAALLLRFDHWWGAWMAALAGIPVRVGHGVPECLPFLTHVVGQGEAHPPVGHWVEQSLAVAERLLEVWGAGSNDGSNGCSRSASRGDERLKSLLREDSAAASRGLGLRFGLTEEDEEAAGRVMAELNLSPHRPVVAFHPGTGSPLKLWPEDRWIMLGWSLASRGAQVVVTGSPAERGSAERIAGAIPDARSLAGRTDMGPLAALFRRCRLVVGVDNGPLHLAVAVGVPTIHLFGPTDPAVFGPWGDPACHRVVSSEWPEAPCGRLDLEPPAGKHAACMEAISLERVAAECEGLLWGGRNAG